MNSVNHDQMKVEYVDHMGDDLAIVNAARVSFDKTSQLEEGSLIEDDVRLIKYLAKHHHWTPFAHTAISLRMGAPVPIRTQCFKHKVGLVENEESRRYIKSTPVVYIPKAFRSIPEGSIKQGSGDVHKDSDYWVEQYELVTDIALIAYTNMIKAGICPEQARLVLPQGAIVNWIWTGNLLSFANFYNKRIEASAQKEVQAVAAKVREIIEPLFPVSWKGLTLQ